MEDDNQFSSNLSTPEVTPFWTAIIIAIIAIIIAVIAIIIGSIAISNSNKNKSTINTIQSFLASPQSTKIIGTTNSWKLATAGVNNNAYITFPTSGTWNVTVQVTCVPVTPSIEYGISDVKMIILNGTTYYLGNNIITNIGQISFGLYKYLYNSNNPDTIDLSNDNLVPSISGNSSFLLSNIIQLNGYTNYNLNFIVNIDTAKTTYYINSWIGLKGDNGTNNVASSCDTITATLISL